MTEQRPSDDRVGDAAVDAAWHRATREQPPAEVDAAILAAARAAVSSETRAPTVAARSRWWSNWQPLAAAAGVLGLSLLLVQMLPRGEFRQGPVAGDGARAPVAESGPPLAPSTPLTRDAVPAPTGRPAAMPGMSAEREAAAGAPAPSMPAASARSPAAALPEPPATWASRVAALHDAGDIAAATAELRAFRAAYPDAEKYLPESLHEWAASVSDDGTR